MYFSKNELSLILEGIEMFELDYEVDEDSEDYEELEKIKLKIHRELDRREKNEKS
jgi:hypothetical protein